MTYHGEPVIAGEARGPLLRLDEPISFWGGVDPHTGAITQPRHPNYRQRIAERVLALPGSIGSSSGSAILLELIHNGRSPRAIIMDDVDAILLIGVLEVVCRFVVTYPVVKLATRDLPTHGEVQISSDGRVAMMPATGEGDDG